MREIDEKLQHRPDLDTLVGEAEALCAPGSGIPRFKRPQSVGRWSLRCRRRRIGEKRTHIELPPAGRSSHAAPASWNR